MGSLEKTFSAEIVNSGPAAMKKVVERDLEATGPKNPTMPRPCHQKNVHRGRERPRTFQRSLVCLQQDPEDLPELNQSAML